MGSCRSVRLALNSLRRGPAKAPVYRQRLWQLGADAVLIALAYYLSWRLRFLETEAACPRYREMLGVTIGFVVVGKLIVSAAFGLYEKWWRYFRLPDFVDVVRASTVSTLILLISLYLLRPFDDAIPRSVLVTDFLLSTFLVGGARLLVGW